ncbi:HesA/MoeB/ThiF family protein [Photobacterium piscicola]|uniref:ThiF family adenylyltransferase n=1 Tax=Photobacterium piscicola TaxID=1378299 RepID=A0ABU6LHU3_9GAMM|nr:ThiF family adenylyltransferase [Photobacterium piscicola]
MDVQTKLRLKESVGITIDAETQRVEFFKSNTRESIIININFPDIINLLKLFNGERTIPEIVKSYQNISENQLFDIAKYLKGESILIEQDCLYTESIVLKNRRLINNLEDYFHSTSKVLQAVENIKTASVMIIGLGAVGSYIAVYLAKMGVSNLILVDNDEVDPTNIHRQYFFEDQINCNKAEVLKEELQFINSDIQITIISKHLESDFFETTLLPYHISLIINCADEPNVDTTSRIIAKYAMKRKIPHIVGGGYNLHLTLIGQTVIPYQTACFQCFNKALNNINQKDLNGVKVLHRENRKLGSFAPLSNIAATLAALDAFKVIIKRYDLLQQANKRIEFNMRNFEFDSFEIVRNDCCEWCGK